MLELRKLTVGPYEMNCYLVLHPETSTGILIDPGDEAERILDWIAPTKITRILLTHGHPDHVGALVAVSDALHAPISLHAADAQRFELKSDDFLEDGDVLAVGEDGLQVIDRLMAQIPDMLAPGGRALLEIGADQAVAAQAIAIKSMPDSKVKILRDLTDRNRLLVIDRGD